MPPHPLRLLVGAALLLSSPAVIGCDSGVPDETEPSDEIRAVYALRSLATTDTEVPIAGDDAACTLTTTEDWVVFYPEAGEIELDGSDFALSIRGERHVINGATTTDTVRVSGSVESYGALLLLRSTAGDTLVAATSPAAPDSPTTLTVADVNQALSDCQLFRFVTAGRSLSTLVVRDGTRDERYDLAGLSEPGRLPAQIRGGRDVYETIEDGWLTLSDDGTYALDLAIQTTRYTLHTPPAPSSTTTRDTTRIRGGYVSAGPIVLFPGPLPVFGVVDGSSLTISGYRSSAPTQTAGEDWTIRNGVLFLSRRDGT